MVKYTIIVWFKIDINTGQSFGRDGEVTNGLVIPLYGPS